MATYGKVAKDEGEARKKDENGDDIEDEEDEKSSKMMMCCIIVMCSMIVLAMIDSFTTHFFKSMCNSLAVWTMDNAPWSFVVFEFIVFCFLVCCLPYGPLGVLSGALFVQKYGNNGIWIAGFALFFTVVVGAIVCFFLARYKFKDAVRKQIDKSPKLHFLKNLDRLMDAGQGVEMVILIRLAPLPKGPTNYFLGTTTVTFRDFLLGTVIVSLPMSFIDVCIGAGAKNVKKDSPLSIGLFVIAVTGFLTLICYVGARAKKKLMALDDEDKQAEAGEELAILGVEDGDRGGDDDGQDPQQTRVTDAEADARARKIMAAGKAKATTGGAPADALSDASLNASRNGSADSVLAPSTISSAGGPGNNGSTAGAPTLLDKLDSLQVIGKPNGYLFPDPRLVLSACDLSLDTEAAATAKRHGCSAVDSCTVQLSSQTFSFQLVSSRVGWSLRVYPRDAKPRFGVHASQEGVLRANDPSAVACVASDGNVKNGPGHGHNFHVVEQVGDLVTLFVGRSLVPSGAGTPLDGAEAHVTLTEAQRGQVHYQVWYTVPQRALLLGGNGALAAGADPDDLANLSAGDLSGQSDDDNASVGSKSVGSRSAGGGSARKKKPKAIKIGHCERFEEAAFLGGDGIDINSKKYTMVRLENKD